MNIDLKIEKLILEGYSDTEILNLLLKEEDGVVSSGDFGNMLPADSKHNWGKTGKELNDESRARLKKWGIVLKHAGGKIKEKLSIKIGKKIYKLI